MQNKNIDQINWSKGHIDPFWTDDFKNFTYTNQPITEDEVNTWKSQGYDYVKSYTGDMYDNRNPMPEWTKKFSEIFNLREQTYTFYRMKTLSIMPNHTDAFNRYINLTGCEYDNVRRIILMLEDWKPGHYFEIDGVGVVNWKAGDWYMWHGDVSHAASNIGIDDRYTLQITGIDYSAPNNWQHLDWKNFTDLPNKINSISNRAKQITTENPYFIYYFNGRIEELEKIIHNKEVVQRLKNTGVDIYLYEPLSSYNEVQQPYYPPMGSKLSMQFYSEFDGSIINDVSHLRALELDSIKIYVENNDLKNVRVHTCDFDLEKYYIFYEDTMQLFTNDLFLKLFDINEFEPLTEDDDTGNFTRHFISLNWRYTPHRMLISAYLASKENSSYQTWYFKTSLQNIMKEPWYDLKEVRLTHGSFYWNLIKGLRLLNNNSPLNLDINKNDSVLHTHPYFKTLIPGEPLVTYKQQSNSTKQDLVKKYYNDVFCDIVNETRFAQPTANVSEKTLRPIFYKKPFVLVGPPYSLAYLHELGYKTFSDWFDESYDNIEDPQERFFKIIEVIDYIHSKPIDELKVIYKEMQEVLEHNRNHLLKLS
jgi:hypothetical protein